MKKIKMALVTAAIVLAVGGAYGTRPALGCESSTQYRFTGSNYVEAGVLGVNYSCWTSGNTCTYYKPDPINQPNTFVACKPGTWVLIP